MADGDSSVLPLQQLGDGRAHDTAAAENHHAAAGDNGAGALDQLHATRRRAWDEACQVAHGCATLIHRVKAGYKR